MLNMTFLSVSSEASYVAFSDGAAPLDERMFRLPAYANLDGFLTFKSIPPVFI